MMSVNEDMREKTKIKICGLTKTCEAEYLNKNKVDFAGVVLFYEKSKRNVSTEAAKEIIKALSNDIEAVAVMVSPTLEQVRYYKGKRLANIKSI